MDYVNDSILEQKAIFLCYLYPCSSDVRADEEVRRLHRRQLDQVLIQDTKYPDDKKNKTLHSNSKMKLFAKATREKTRREYQNWVSRTTTATTPCRSTKLKTRSDGATPEKPTFFTPPP